MSCFYPLTGYRSPGGQIRFSRRGSFVDLPRVTVSCGQCIGCRLERSRQWAVRCMHEASLHDANSFITLTYADEHVPYGGSLVKEAWQKFAKRLRKRCGPFRYFHCGEYGEHFGRPHYHACVFGIDFAWDRKRFAVSGGNVLYESPTLNEVWGLGHALIGDVTFKSAAYVARYVMKKVNGEAARNHYEGVYADTGEIVDRLPEYVTMSRGGRGGKGGIGAEWFKRFKNDVYPSDFVVVDGVKSRPPKYYDYCLELLEPAEIDVIKRKRVRMAKKHAEDQSEDRLRVREQVQLRRIERLARSLT